MPQTEEAKQRLREARKKLVLSLVVNGLVPLVLYTLVRPLLVNDATALAIAAAVPVVRTVALWVWRRRVDWIGLLAVLGFAVAVAVTQLSGGSTLPLELRRPVVTGTIGLIFLISVATRRPLLLPLLRVFTRSDPVLSRTFEKGSSDPASRRRITILTAAVGFAFLGEAVANIILALTLPMGTFLVVSRVVNWVILGSGVAFLWWISRRVGGFRGQVGENNR